MIRNVMRASAWFLRLFFWIQTKRRSRRAPKSPRKGQAGLAGKPYFARISHVGANAAAEGMDMTGLLVNGRNIDVDAEPDTPLLWAIRENLGLTGTKYGCGIGACGACTVLIDGAAARACTVTVADAAGRQITTIEGLADKGVLHRVQQAWVDADAPQCGYCQPGMIMAVVALLNEKPRPSDAEIDAAITNICRCGTFQQVRAAIHAAIKA
jgi:isoquinoline 1-oxidoreductase subunit alpha